MAAGGFRQTSLPFPPGRQQRLRAVPAAPRAIATPLTFRRMRISPSTSAQTKPPAQRTIMVEPVLPHRCGPAIWLWLTSSRLPTATRYLASSIRVSIQLVKVRTTTAISTTSPVEATAIRQQPGTIWPRDGAVQMDRVCSTRLRGPRRLLALACLHRHRRSRLRKVV